MCIMLVMYNTEYTLYFENLAPFAIKFIWQTFFRQM
jgi:hypothetical protein